MMALELEHTRMPRRTSANIETRHLVESQQAFTQAFHNARALGREMLLEFERMDEARRELEKQGIYTQIEFKPELQAAYRSLQRLLNTGELDVPDFLRRDSVT